MPLHSARQGPRWRSLAVLAIAQLSLLLFTLASEARAQGLDDIATYPNASPAPVDVAVGANGNVFALKNVAQTPLLLVEQRDRDGVSLGADLSLTGDGEANALQRIAVGPGDDVFVLTDDPGLLGRQIVRLTPGQSNSVIASYPITPPGVGTPVDLSVGADGEVLVLKQLGMLLVVERRDRTGSLLGPDLGLGNTGGSAGLPRITGGDDGDIFVSTEVPLGLGFFAPGVIRLGVGAPPESILVFGSVGQTSLLDLSVSLGGDLVLLRTDPVSAAVVIDRYDRHGDLIALPYPAGNAASSNTALAAGMGNDAFLVGLAGAASQDVVLRRLALVQTVSQLADFDTFFASPVDLASDDLGNVLVLKSSFSTLLIERRDRGGSLLGPDLVIANSGAPTTPAALTAGSGLDLFVVVQDSVDPMQRLIVRLSELESPLSIASYSSLTPQPVDVGSDTLGDLVVLRTDPAGSQTAVIERRDRDGALLGTSVLVPAASGAIQGPRIAGAGVGEAFVLTDDPNDFLTRTLYHVPAGGPALPLVEFRSGPAMGVPMAVDVATDPMTGDVLVLLADFGLQQVSIERYDPSGVLIEDVGAAPSGMGGAIIAGRLAAGLSFDRFVISPSTAMTVRLLKLAMPDADGDGTPDDGDFSFTSGDAPCTGGATELCDDNCRLFANTDQSDLGTVASLADLTGSVPDGIGDACQCSDGSGDGSGNDVDLAQVRDALAGFPLRLAAPELCNVWGPVDAANADGSVIRADCNIVDVVVMTRAFRGLGPGIAPVCGPAVGLP